MSFKILNFLLSKLNVVFVYDFNLINNRESLRALCQSPRYFMRDLSHIFKLRTFVLCRKSCNKFMTGYKLSQRVKQFLAAVKSNGYMLLLVFFVSGTLLVMNYFTIRILSGVRAYIHGESYYSKGQKDASRYLLLYLDTHNEGYWELFNQNLNIPLSDRKARIALLNGNKELAIESFVAGKNHSDDAVDMVWLFTTFQQMHFLKEPIEIWTRADSILIQHKKTGEEIRASVLNGTLNDSMKAAFKKQVYEQGIGITAQETRFLESLGKTSRILRGLILSGNTVFIIFIVVGAGIFSMRIINRLINSEERLLERNKELNNTNAELDKFVYSASHDLRAPITSLKGLIEITKNETDPKEVERYFSLMVQSLDKQDEFIKQIISFSKNKRSSINVEKVDIAGLIDGIVNRLKFMNDNSTCTIKTDVTVNQAYTDAFRLEIVLSNLLSNAIKYRDPQKERHFIEISASREGDMLQFAVKDTGSGISAADKQKIFDMFYMSNGRSDGTGVGLYIVKDTVEKLNGSIHVDSEVGKWTIFEVKIPVDYDQR